MAYLCNVCYVLLLVALSPWLLLQMLRTGKYREGYGEKFFGNVPQRSGSRQCVWLHAVSVGEINLLGALIREIDARRPDWECVISTTTRTGYSLARTRYPEHTVFYCPLDFSWATRRAMQRVRPDMLVLAELELWPNLIRAASDYGAKIALVNGRLSEKSFRGYHKLRWLLARILGRIDILAVQNEIYRDRFCRLGANQERVVVTGSMKFDGVETSRTNPTTGRLRQLARFAETDVVFLAGSTQQPEEQFALAAYQAARKRFPRLRLVLAPRHPERFAEVEAMLRREQEPYVLRSRLDAEGNRALPRILLVDVIGELAAWWGTADVGYVGGSMGKRGGQNMIEPAAYGVAVSFGPNTRNFRDVVEAMLTADAATVVRDSSEMESMLFAALENPDQAQRQGVRGQQLVRGHQGATKKTMQLLGQLLPLQQDGTLRRAA